MKRWAVYIIFGGTLLVACDNKDINNPTPRTDRKELQQEIQSSAADVLEKARQERDEFIAKTQEELQEIDKETVALKRRLQNLSGEAESELKEEFVELQEERDAAQQKLDELKTQTAEKWQILRTGVSAAIAELKETVHKLKVNKD